ncbi:AT-hook motif nuclear-localized protein 6-like [Senna tora]|uniref:AT-hook motif nuclear-localized protein n=1 Tax=Senna tora TaxID=362788 RepID=A0A834W8S0_9FABA|nr:AT-hook motif nuclear-localized protein 6-like [Senna tora]
MWCVECVDYYLPPLIWVLDLIYSFIPEFKVVYVDPVVRFPFRSGIEVLMRKGIFCGWHNLTTEKESRIIDVTMLELVAWVMLALFVTCQESKAKRIASKYGKFDCDFKSFILNLQLSILWLSISCTANGIAYFVGANFTPHILTVNAGEDVTMKVMSFSQQGSRAICILSANGMISNVTLRQPTSSGGTLTYEGRFEILSLSGSYMPTENGITRSRSGGMSVSLAGPDGRVVGGGLAGLLIAAGPVQVVVGSFLPGHQQEHKPKKQNKEYISTINPTHHFNPMSDQEIHVSFGGVKPIMTPAALQGDNNIAFNNVQVSRDSSTDRESNPSQSNAGVSC